MSYLPYILVVVGALAFFLVSRRKHATRSRGPIPASGWRIGPVVNGENQSRNMPAEPTMQGAGWFLDFPANGSVNYVQRFNGPPLGTSLTLRYRFEGGPVYGAEQPSEPATISLMLQRKGDDWIRPGYRWWSQMIPLVPGEHEVTVPLTVEHWGDMLDVPDARAFAASLRDLDNIGVTFGSAAAPTHGAFGSGRFTLLSLG